MKKLLIVGCLLFLSFPVIAFSQQKEPQVLVASGDPWPPFADPNDPREGLSLTITRAAFATQGIKVVMVFVPWARAEYGLENGQYDIIPTIWKTEERDRKFLFSIPYLKNEIRFVKRKGDSFQFTGLDSLKGKQIGLIRGYGYSDSLLQYKGYTKVLHRNLMINLNMLISGRIDLTVSDEIVALATISGNNKSLLDRIEFVDPPFSENLLYVAANRSNPRAEEIIEAFNIGLRIIQKNGKFRNILNLYGLSSESAVTEH